MNAYVNNKIPVNTPITQNPEDSPHNKKFIGIKSSTTSIHE